MADSQDKWATHQKTAASFCLAFALLALSPLLLQSNLSSVQRVIPGVVSINLMVLALGFRLVSRYISQRRNVERQLQNATHAAQAANTAKSAFLANMSHEIRTPMTAILGYTDMLLEPGQNQPERVDCLNSIRRNARHLLDLLNDVLDISKIEAGRMTAERIIFDLPQLAAEVASMMRPRAREKGLQFRLLFDGPIPQKVRADPVRLKQILVNLVGNAIKFSEKGHVELCVSCQVQRSNQTGPDAVEDNSVVRFDVIDTGIGLTPMQIERIFQPFSQADESMSRRFGGSGLGLTISRRLAALLGGDISVESKPLVGSKFTVQIEGGPLDEATMRRGLTEAMFAATQPPAVQAGPVEARPLLPEVQAAPVGPQIKFTGKILFVEDGKDNQRLISAHLRRGGAEVVLADDGSIALDLIGRQTFDLVLLDMQMPVLDGYGAAREMRRLGYKLPIIALTAHAMSGDREKCIAAGCTDYLSKPVDRQQLLRLVARYLSSNKEPEMKETNFRSEYQDDPDMRELIGNFVSGFPDQVQRLTAHLEHEEMEELRRTVHQLKGAGGGYGFPLVTELAAKAEQTLKASQSLEHVRDQVNELIMLMLKIHQNCGTSPDQSSSAPASDSR